MAYWLFKTEPEEFSIDDLQKMYPNAEPWDGIRNYQARNILRDKVQVGDFAYIYHSSCKNVGIVGVAEIVKAGYPDPAQFDPHSRYFDEKASKDEPKWFCVEVKFKQKFTRVISLKEIKQVPQLSEMQLVKQGRLSVQAVTAKEWQWINSHLAK
ncbi:EVE domain-containing protein [Aliikangiella sp. IMCC44632]